MPDEVQHTDLVVAPHADIAPAHTDVAAAHADGNTFGIHTDVTYTPHADAIISPHTDTAPVHVDYNTNIHHDDGTGPTKLVSPEAIHHDLNAPKK